MDKMTLEQELQHLKQVTKAYDKTLKLIKKAYLPATASGDATQAMHFLRTMTQLSMQRIKQLEVEIKDAKRNEDAGTQPVVGSEGDVSNDSQTA